jgi:hypothetical protein
VLPQFTRKRTSIKLEKRKPLTPPGDPPPCLATTVARTAFHYSVATEKLYRDPVRLLRPSAAVRTQCGCPTTSAAVPMSSGAVSPPSASVEPPSAAVSLPSAAVLPISAAVEGPSAAVLFLSASETASQCERS